ncbi:Smr/MutS family protein [Nitrosomonas sp.]|uniref:Smr/MutS family protein n=1 Tax=Nitrosomonas sp. TaxID=42353 RepID=UPI00207DFFE4|nr:Smr/MutS family protein [Nitrosomonas sp.]GJL76884.1 MAG: hypothetical protein NMNS02_29900 [Nitrosomonas sp.]
MSQNDDAINTEMDDEALFRAAMEGVAPLNAPDKTVLKLKKPAPRPRRKNLREQFSDAESEAVTLDIDMGDEWSFSRPGVSRQTLRRLKRGYWDTQLRLDLHGFTQEAAKRQLAAFLDEALARNIRCVQIIHGKGLSSKDRVPVLKNRIGSWLVQRGTVLAFCQARPEDGGSGAVMVLLKGQ